MVKRFVWRELKSHGVKLKNALEVIQFLCEHLSNRPKSSYIRKKKHFKETSGMLCQMMWIKVPLHYACDTMQGTVKVHNICATNKHILTQLMVKRLACLYV